MRSTAKIVKIAWYTWVEDDIISVFPQVYCVDGPGAWISHLSVQKCSKDILTDPITPVLMYSRMSFPIFS